MNKDFFSSDIEILKHQFFVQILIALQILKRNRKIVIGLSGGNSLKKFYMFFVQNYRDIDEGIRAKIFFCLLDERVVPFDHEQSNYKMLNEILFSPLLQEGLISEKQILLPNFVGENYEEEYFQKVQQIDIGLLGVGEDGHIASLFPSHPLLKNEAISYLTITDSPKPPLQRITVSKNMLLNIVHPFVFFMGDIKYQTFLNFIDPNISPFELPVKMLTQNRNLIIFRDRGNEPK